MDQVPKPRMVKVVFPGALGVGEPNQTGGFVGTGASQDTSRSKLGDKAKAVLTHVVEEIDADKIAQQTLDLAQRMRPAFDTCAEALRKIKVSEISVGCAITAEAGVVFAGMGVEASSEITFDLSWLRTGSRVHMRYRHPAWLRTLAWSHAAPRPANLLASCAGVVPERVLKPVRVASQANGLTTKNVVTLIPKHI